MRNDNPQDFRAFILAAGEGRRLRPYTNDIPKPMVRVAGKPLLGHILDYLSADGILDVCINTYYKPHVITDYIAKDQSGVRVSFSHEEALLDTGLGMKRALHHMACQPFFAINGDAFWLNGSRASVFERLAEVWNPKNMDILLLLQPVERMSLTKGVGDYLIDKDGRAYRQKDQSGSHMFAGVRVCTPAVFEKTPETPFSFLELMDRAEAAGRLYALEHDGAWHHISTPSDLEAVNEDMESSETLAKTQEIAI